MGKSHPEIKDTRVFIGGREVYYSNANIQPTNKSDYIEIPKQSNNKEFIRFINEDPS